MYCISLFSSSIILRKAHISHMHISGALDDHKHLNLIELLGGSVEEPENDKVRLLQKIHLSQGPKDDLSAPIFGNTYMITCFNYGYRELLFNLVGSLKKIGLSKFLNVAISQADYNTLFYHEETPIWTFKLLRDVHFIIHKYAMKSGRADFGGNDFHDITKVKLEIVSGLLKDGDKNVLFLDADIAVLKDFRYDLSQ
eukprot:UN27142